MSPSHNRRSAPALSDDDIISVLLRIPPDDPARLVRASLACKAWRRILTSPDFCRLYREFHRTPPLLGLVVSSWSRNMTYASRFVPTTAFHLKSYHDFYPGRNWKAVDSRHGRILVEPVGDDQDDGLSIGGYFVWDPITNGQWGVPSPRIPTDTSLESSIGAVLCAKEHCDHLGCHGPPFLVAMVASHYGATFACVYSSESGVWSHIVTLEHGVSIDSEGCSILVGNTLNFPLAGIYGVLQYKLGEQKLSVIDLPDNFPDDESLLFISVEDDVLVFAGWRGTKLSIWSIEAGALAWTQRKVIDLEKLLPPRAFEPKIDDNGDKYMPNLSAYAEGTVFLSTMAGLFTVDLDSGRTNKVADEEMAINVTPWTSFYTQDHARRVMPWP